jgi:hypothetical protein
MRKASGKDRLLSIDIHDSFHEESYIADENVFIKDDVAINSTGKILATSVNMTIKCFSV